MRYRCIRFTPPCADAAQLLLYEIRFSLDKFNLEFNSVVFVRYSNCTSILSNFYVFRLYVVREFRCVPLRHMVGVNRVNAKLLVPGTGRSRPYIQYYGECVQRMRFSSVGIIKQHTVYRYNLESS